MIDATAERNLTASSRSFSAQPVPVIREPRMSYGWYRTLHAATFGLSGIVALIVPLLVAYLTAQWVSSGEAPAVPKWGIFGTITAWTIGAAAMGLLPGWGLGAVEEFRRQIKLLVLLFAGVLLAMGVGNSGLRTTLPLLVAWFLVSLFTVPFARILTKRALLAFRLYSIPTAIYGAGQAGKRVVELLRKEKGLGYDLVVAYDDDPERWGEHLAGLPVLGSAELVMPHAAAAIVAAPDIESSRLLELLEGPLLSYRTVLVIPEITEAPTFWVRPRDLSGVLGLEFNFRLTCSGTRATKRCFDYMLVLITAPAWIPLVVVIAGLIWLEDRKSPLFFQERIGRGGTRFKTMKFRTMIPDAEAALHKALGVDKQLRQEWESDYKLKNDPRITRVGKLLRQYSLDELPQLFNVLRGEMSLVGPRPLPQYHHEKLPQRVRRLREHVLPGLTGMWQISGRSEAGTEGMNRWDPYYVRNWSPWLDAVILVRTVRVVIRSNGAY